jgi:hypothetical protein|nr:MAG TPA: hypothetical protein [Bacteriophage sp.]
MKFRNPETGEVFDSLREASDKFCSDHDCFWRECPLDKANESRACWDWIQEYPIEAARLMGYEVVEEMRDPQLNEGEMDKEMEKNHFSTIKEEANMDKLRICEVLGVEKGERFDAGPYKDAYIDSFGTIRTNMGTLMDADRVCELINHPDRIIRKPRWTEQEVEIVKNLLEVVGPAELRKVADMVTMKVDGKIIYLRKDAFPSLKNEMVVTLYEIIGGAE